MKAFSPRFRRQALRRPAGFALVFGREAVVRGRTRVVVAAVVAAVISLAGGGPATASAQNDFDLVLSEAAGDSGAGIVLRSSVPDLALFGDGWANRVSSLRVLNGIAVAAYTQPNYRGTCETFTSRDAWLGDNAIGNDTIRSVKLGHTCFGPVPGTVIVTDVAVVAGPTPGIACPHGYTKKRQDLNQGAGGDYVYLCVKWGPRTTEEVFHLVDVYRDVTAEVSRFFCSGLGGQPVEGNLNSGVSDVSPGMLCLFRRTQSEPSVALQDLDFVVSDDDMVCYIPFVCTDDPTRDIDEACASKLGTGAYGNMIRLNAGARDKYIYLCVKPTDAAVPITRVDDRPPAIELVARTPADAGGWNRSDVTVKWRCTAGGSPLTSPAVVAQTVSSEGANQFAVGACTDLAGNEVTDKVTGINIDRSLPDATLLSRTPPNNAGWNHDRVLVTWMCRDRLSGPEQDTISRTVASEGADQSTTATCRDRAGNERSATVGDINIDRTAPRIGARRTPEPNAAGWNNTDVDVEFQCEDPLSGVQHCTPPRVVRMEGDARLVPGVVIDRAGNTAQLTVGPIRIDKTAPEIHGRVTPEPNAAGWHNSDVDVAFTCTDGLSKIESCSPGETLSKDGKGQSVLGKAVDRAGNVADYQVGGINIDKTAPTITGAPTPRPNKFGWNNTDVTVEFACKDATSGVSGKKCPLPVEFSNEGAGQVARATITDAAGNVAEATVEVNIDKTPPQIARQRTPAPNANGWNNTDVTVGFGCKDALSGVEGCPRDAVVHDEGAGQEVPGEATDRAGNVATTKVGPINIDKTAPAIAARRTPEPNAAGWNNTDVTVSFACNDQLAGILTCSEPVVLGEDGAGQSAEGAAVDQAGNRASTRVEDINIDRSGPEFSCAAEPAVLWPPNHALVPVEISVELTDPLSGATGFVLASATSSEPDDADGDGSTTGDIVDFEPGTPDVHGSLRAERSGTGPGRTYTLTYRGSDAADNASTCDAVVRVSHDQG